MKITGMAINATVDQRMSRDIGARAKTGITNFPFTFLEYIYGRITTHIFQLPL